MHLPHEPQDSSAHPVVLRKGQKIKQSLEEHHNQGHVPFHEGCLSRSAANSFTQHRRKNKDKLNSEVAADFFFIEKHKFMILVDIYSHKHAWSSSDHPCGKDHGTGSPNSILLEPHSFLWKC